MSARIAVIIPCFNDGRYVTGALESIREQEPVETVIIDDGSSQPETLEVLERLAGRGINVVHHERNSGLAAARHTGLDRTSAPYVFPLDADDFIFPGALSALADKLDADPGAAACIADYEEFQGSKRLIRHVPERLDPYRIAYSNQMPGPALFRRSALEQVGAWADAHGHIAGYEDWNLWMGLAEAGHRVVKASDVRTFRYRQHGGRMLGGARRKHRHLYQGLRDQHPDLFSRLPEYREASDLGPLMRRLYPYLYGSRPRFAIEGLLKSALDRSGLRGEKA